MLGHLASIPSRLKPSAEPLRTAEQSSLIVQQLKPTARLAHNLPQAPSTDHVIHNARHLQCYSPYHDGRGRFAQYFGIIGPGVFTYHH